MKAQDMMDQNNNRAEAIKIITTFCDKYGFSYHYTEKIFTIDLPSTEPVPITRPHRTKKQVSLTAFDNIDFSKIESDELPPIDETLNEGETPNES